MSGQTIALVTGANKGIGYEIAAGLGALGWYGIPKVGVFLWRSAMSLVRCPTNCS